MEDLRQGWDITYFRHLKEGQTVANFVDAGSLSSVHSRLAYIGSGCLLRMLLVSTSIVFEDSLFFLLDHTLVKRSILKLMIACSVCHIVD
jgi:hypothetical protein